MNIEFIVRHFGNQSVAKLAAVGADILGLETTQAGVMHRVMREGREELMLMTEVGETLLGW